MAPLERKKTKRSQVCLFNTGQVYKNLSKIFSRKCFEFRGKVANLFLVMGSNITGSFIPLLALLWVFFSRNNRPDICIEVFRKNLFWMPEVYFWPFFTLTYGHSSFFWVQTYVRSTVTLWLLIDISLTIVVTLPTFAYTKNKAKQC